MNPTSNGEMFIFFQFESIRVKLPCYWFVYFLLIHTKSKTKYIKCLLIYVFILHLADNVCLILKFLLLCRFQLILLKDAVKSNTGIATFTYNFILFHIFPIGFLHLNYGTLHRIKSFISILKISLWVFLSCNFHIT